MRGAAGDNGGGAMDGTILRLTGKALGCVLLLGLALPGRAATVEYIHTDALGSVVAVTDSTGTVIEHREYEPYGRQLIPTTVTDGPAFTGHVGDAATGLDYMQQRYYDPQIGRFLSVDPMAANASTGGNFNRYKYANNNPYRFTDPDGRMDKDTRKELVKDRRSMMAHSSLAASVRTIGGASSVGTNSGGKNSPVTGSAPKRRPLAGDVVQLAKNIAGGINDRTTFTAEAAGAFGPGVAVQANKALGPSADSVGAQFVIGEGAYAGANANFRVFSFGSQDGVGSSGKLAVDPGSYLNIKAGAGISLGFNLDFNGSGGGSLSVSVGIGLGEQAIVKPPATLGIEKEL